MLTSQHEWDEFVRWGNMPLVQGDTDERFKWPLKNIAFPNSQETCKVL